MEAEKSRDLQSANWRLKRVDGVSSSPSLSQRTGSQAEGKFSLTPPICVIPAFKGLDEVLSPWGGPFALLSLPNSNVHLIQEHSYRHT